jgi:hypothetical protein
MPRGGARPGAGRPTNAERARRNLLRLAEKCRELRIDETHFVRLSEAELEQMMSDAPPELRALHERRKAMKQMAARMRSGEVVTYPVGWGGKRLGAGRPIGPRNQPNRSFDNQDRVRLRKLLSD